MRRFLTPMFVALATLGLAQSVRTPDQVVAGRDLLNNQVVTVRGEVAAYEAKTSRRGNPYTTFGLKGSEVTVAVYLRGHLAKPPKNGDTVNVTGTFRKEKTVGNHKFKNEIDATAAKGKPFGVKLVK